MSAAANLPKHAKFTLGCSVTAALTPWRAGAFAPFGHELCDLSRPRCYVRARTCRTAAFAAFRTSPSRVRALRAQLWQLSSSDSRACAQTRMRVTSGCKSLELDYGNRPSEYRQ